MHACVMWGSSNCSTALLGLQAPSPLGIVLAQMTRTIQNYQKAYRKKVEGLKTELYTTRADNSHLRKQVRPLSLPLLDWP